MNYRSFYDLNRTIASNIYKIPSDIDLIMAFTREGLIVANILALHLHIPITDYQYLKKGKFITPGRRISKMKPNIERCKNILIVHDTIKNSKNNRKIIDEINKKYRNKNIISASVYADEESLDKNDINLEICPAPHIFQWNIFNHSGMANFCVDIDGVLCYDPLPLDNDDGERYLKFIENAPPLVRIQNKIGCLVTNRLEKYRTPTEKWLKKNGIVYGELIMQNLPNQQARREAKNYGSFKGMIYKSRVKSDLFIESSFKQAREIADISGKVVYCVDKRIMIYPNQYYPEQNDKKKYIVRKWKRQKKRTRRYLKKLSNYFW